MMLMSIAPTFGAVETLHTTTEGGPLAASVAMWASGAAAAVALIGALLHNDRTMHVGGWAAVGAGGLTLAHAGTIKALDAYRRYKDPLIPRTGVFLETAVAAATIGVGLYAVGKTKKT